MNICGNQSILPWYSVHTKQCVRVFIALATRTNWTFCDEAMLKARGRSGPIISNKYSGEMLLAACGKSRRTWFRNKACQSSNVWQRLTSIMIEWVEFNAPLDTVQVILKVVLTANHSNDTDKKVKSNYFIVHLKVDQRDGQLSLPHLGNFFKI